MSPTQIFFLVAALAVIAFVGRLVGLFRQSDDIEKKIDYSKMREWEDDDD